MSRHKSISDDAVLDSLLIGIRRLGPSGLSFAQASKYTGLSASTLVQRFGSRDAMVEAILLRAWDRLDAQTVEADRLSGPGAEGAVEFLVRITQSEDADYISGDGLLLLREDIRNPLLRARGASWGKVLAIAIARRLPPAIDGIEAGWEAIRLWQGAILWWSFSQDGLLADALESGLNSWRERYRVR